MKVIRKRNKTDPARPPAIVPSSEDLKVSCSTCIAANTTTLSIPETAHDSSVGADMAHLFNKFITTIRLKAPM